MKNREKELNIKLKLVVYVIFYFVLIVLNLCPNLLLFMFPAKFSVQFI